MKNNPKMTVTVHFKSLKDGSDVERKFVVTKADINDVDWYGGNCGDNFFDNAFESDSDRFTVRIEDCVFAMLWDPLDEEDHEPDPDLEGDHPDGLDYNDRLSFEYDLGEFEDEDFYPDR